MLTNPARSPPTGAAAPRPPPLTVLLYLKFWFMFYVYVCLINVSELAVSRMGLPAMRPAGQTGHLPRRFSVGRPLRGADYAVSDVFCFVLYVCFHVFNTRVAEKARLARCLALAVRRAGTDVTCEAAVLILSPTCW